MSKRKPRAASPADHTIAVFDIARGVDTVEVARPPSFEIRCGRVYINDRHERLGMTSAMRRRALFMLLCYLQARGEFVTDRDLDELAEKAGQTTGHWTEVRNALPESIRALIETQRQRGSRLNVDF
jgi:hypothetical protein